MPHPKLVEEMAKLEHLRSVANAANVAVARQRIVVEQLKLKQEQEEESLAHTGSPSGDPKSRASLDK